MAFQEFKPINNDIDISEKDNNTLDKNIQEVKYVPGKGYKYDVSDYHSTEEQVIDDIEEFSKLPTENKNKRWEETVNNRPEEGFTATDYFNRFYNEATKLYPELETDGKIKDEKEPPKEEQVKKSEKLLKAEKIEDIINTYKSNPEEAYKKYNESDISPNDIFDFYGSASSSKKGLELFYNGNVSDNAKTAYEKRYGIPFDDAETEKKDDTVKVEAKVEPVKNTKSYVESSDEEKADMLANNPESVANELANKKAEEGKSNKLLEIKNNTELSEEEKAFLIDAANKLTLTERDKAEMALNETGTLKTKLYGDIAELEERLKATEDATEKNALEIEINNKKRAIGQIDAAEEKYRAMLENTEKGNSVLSAGKDALSEFNKPEITTILGNYKNGEYGKLLSNEEKKFYKEALKNGQISKEQFNSIMAEHRKATRTMLTLVADEIGTSLSNIAQIIKGGNAGNVSMFGKMRNAELQANIEAKGEGQKELSRQLTSQYEKIVEEMSEDQKEITRRIFNGLEDSYKLRFSAADAKQQVENLRLMGQMFSEWSQDDRENFLLWCINSGRLSPGQSLIVLGVDKLNSLINEYNGATGEKTNQIKERTVDNFNINLYNKGLNENFPNITNPDVKNFSKDAINFDNINESNKDEIRNFLIMNKNYADSDDIKFDAFTKGAAQKNSIDVLEKYAENGGDLSDLGSLKELIELLPKGTETYKRGLVENYIDNNKKDKFAVLKEVKEVVPKFDTESVAFEYAKSLIEKGNFLTLNTVLQNSDGLLGDNAINRLVSIAVNKDLANTPYQIEFDRNSNVKNLLVNGKKNSSPDVWEEFYNKYKGKYSVLFNNENNMKKFKKMSKNQISKLLYDIKSNKELPDDVYDMLKRGTINSKQKIANNNLVVGEHA